MHGYVPERKMNIPTAFKECLETLNVISQKLENASYPVIACNPSIVC